MKKPRGVIPLLSDLSQSGACAVPLDLVNRWTEGERSPDRAKDLLDPFRIRGLVACSDMCGLSRMTRRMPLHEVMRLVSLPKEWIHAMTTGIGGRAIGTWVADNTQTFFPDSISPDAILRTLLEFHRRLPQGFPENGFCLHHGDFYYVGGGLYGADAELVEHLAEEKTTAAETLVTQAVIDRLRNPGAFRFEKRSDLVDYGNVYRVSAKSHSGDGSPLGPTGYPAPFPEEVRRALGGADQGESALAAYRLEKAALLVRLCHKGTAAAGPAELLDELAECALSSLLARQAMPDPSLPFKTGGRVSIAVFDDLGQALETARRVRSSAAAQGMSVCCGIDRGPLLVFPMADGRWEFAGEPINIASKQAEDCGSPGWIYLTRPCAQGLDLPAARLCEWNVSGIRIESLGIPPEPLKSAVGSRSLSE